MIVLGIFSGVCLVGLCYFIGWKLGQLDSRVEKLENQVTYLIMQVRGYEDLN